MDQPRYADATWSLLVTDVESGESFYELNADRMSFTGSTRKLFSVGMALRQLGADHRIDDAGLPARRPRRRRHARPAPSPSSAPATWCSAAGASTPTPSRSRRSTTTTPTASGPPSSPRRTRCTRSTSWPRRCERARDLVMLAIHLPFGKGEPAFEGELLAALKDEVGVATRVNNVYAAFWTRDDSIVPGNTEYLVAAIGDFMQPELRSRHARPDRGSRWRRGGGPGLPSGRHGARARPGSVRGRVRGAQRQLAPTGRYGLHLREPEHRMGAGFVDELLVARGRRDVPVGASDGHAPGIAPDHRPGFRRRRPRPLGRRRCAFPD